jgi:alkanesulfonate monooxygenase SsuD/methylene tetrahydromethanopterin reductase-like flavin-dependent oxidoreductase (luciferase family)
MARRAFGINLPVSGRSYSQKEVDLDFRVLRDIAVAADQYGFSTIGVHDHLLNPQGSSPGGKEMPEKFRNGIVEAWTTLSALSTVTSRARLTNVVLCNLFRPPAMLAKMASTLDLISDGRLDLALGAGWFRGECLAYGIPWKPYRIRLEMLRESVQLIKRLWMEDEVTFTGKHYQIEKGILRPKPVQKPRPPIVIGGSSENAMRIAVDEADGWDVDTGPCTFELFQQRYARLESYCKEVGRDVKSIRVSVSATPILAADVPEARKLATVWAERIKKDPREYISNKSVFLGTAEDITAAAEKWFESGVNQVNFLMPHDALYAQTLCREIAELSP